MMRTKQFLSQKRPRRLSLRWMLVVPFVLLILAAVSLVGYLSWRNGEAIVAELSEEIRSEISAQIEQKLNDHLKTAELVNQINVDALESGLIDAQDLSGLQSYLMRQLQQFPALSGITIASERPDYIGILYDEQNRRVLSTWNRAQGGITDSTLDAQGRIVSSTLDLDYDHRQRPWYRNAVQAGKPIWQDAYLTVNPARLVISADRLFRQNRLLGVVDAEVTLTSLSEFLGSLKIGRTGETFIMEQSGLLVATSTIEPPFERVGKEEQRRSAFDSGDPQIRAAARYLRAEFGDLQRIDRPLQREFHLNGESEFLMVRPFGAEMGINWLVVVIVPKSDFTTQIEAHSRTTLLLGVATLLGAIALSLRASRWIAQPLLRMSRASQAIAAGELDQRVPVDLRVAELDGMAHSFNQMAQQLSQSFDRVNEALQASEAKFTKVFRASPDAIAIATVGSGRYVDVNTSFCQISGYDRAEIIGRTPFELKFPLTPEGFARFGQILRKRRVLRNVEVDFQTKAGDVKTALVSAELIEIEGQPRILAVIKDISERKRAEAERRRVALERKQVAAELKRAKEAAETASHAKSQFLANMSHELRSPLNAILGFAQLMSLSDKLPPEHHEYLRIIHHSGEHLLHLINDILDSAKIEAGCLPLDQTRFDLHRLLQELLEMFRLKAQEKSIVLSCDRADRVPQWIYADELKLRQVLINLLSNAIKFTQAGSVTLSVEVRDQELRLGEAADARSPTLTPQSLTLHFWVADTGIGIESNQLDKIFEAFVQTARGQHAAAGTGLGLSISRAFVQLMGGEISVCSRVDEGSVFAFAIPVGVVALPIASQPARCLIAVDGGDRQLSTLLHLSGYDIREASSAQEVIDLWQSWQPQLIWMDVQMLAIDGATTIEKIRAAGRDRVPVIFALGDCEAEARSIALSAGCDDFFCRPLHENQIRGTMNKYLELGRDAPASAANPVDLTCLQQQIALLPVAWVADFHRAALEGDLDLMLTLVEAIRPQHEDLAAAIAALASSFQYVQLLTLTQPPAPSSEPSP